MVAEILFIVTVSSSVVSVATSVEELCQPRLGTFALWQQVQKPRDYAGLYFWKGKAYREVRCVERKESRWTVEVK